MSKLLVIQSDFGLGDGAVSAMHGVANMVDPSIKVDDLTHDIKPYNIFEASYRLIQTIRYWPEETVFVSVVDPGVGSSRKSIAVKTTTNHYLVTPDNGTLSHIKKYIGIESAKIIDEKNNRLPFSEKSHTFHGRDVYSYNGAKIAADKSYYGSLEDYDIENIETLEINEAYIENGIIHGTVDILDIRFGSLWTNIPQEMLEENDIHTGDTLKIKIYHDETKKYENQIIYGHSFSDVKQGEVVAYINSLINLGIAINQSNFSKTYNIGTGNSWTIKVEKINQE
ncbi:MULTISPECIES: S-adenosyl-l-methionine hydroxide adenosyltransferase family protein [Anaerococcus]|mgnify:FL=1|jgi:protein of hypothetical function|nr:MULTISPECIES: S-adenosyl-l-methionine hydroxide adenosyltransferase family protein [Anaerococcus]MBS6105504.1 S-adenosyl-l-methionine hydroxide adenosyltransferase family protein [Anaerococcus sp.]